MKIAQITSSFPLPGESPYLGPENVVYNLVNSFKLLKSDASIDVITIRNDIDKYMSYESGPNVTIHYYPRIKYIPRTFGDAIIFRNILKKSAYDIVHSHHVPSFVFSKNIKAIKILTIHGLIEKEKKYEQNPFIRFGYYDLNIFLRKKILSKIDCLVAISPYVLDELKNMGLFHAIKKIYQIDNPIDKAFFSTSKNYVSNNNLIFIPSIISERKNQLSAIFSIIYVKEEIKNIKLILTGGNNKEYLDKVLKEVDENALEDNVEYLGKVSRYRIFELYNKASIIYLLSKQETQPMTVLEAMASGTPVIASNIKSNEYLIDHGKTGYLVDPNDSKKIAEYTIELLNNTEKRLIMGENARKIALKKYHPDVVAEKTLKMYEDVMR